MTNGMKGDLIVITNSLESDNFGVLAPIAAQMRIRFERFEHHPWPFQQLLDPATHGDGVGEKDCYDIDETNYIIFYREGKALAVLRELPTDTKFSDKSYMIRDMLIGSAARPEQMMDIDTSNREQMLEMGGGLDLVERATARQSELIYPHIKLPEDPLIIEGTRIAAVDGLSDELRDYCMSYITLASQMHGLLRGYQKTMLLTYPGIWKKRWTAKGCAVEWLGNPVEFPEPDGKTSVSRVGMFDYSEQNLAHIRASLPMETSEDMPKIVIDCIRDRHPGAIIRPQLVDITKEGTNWTTGLKTLTPFETFLYGFNQKPAEEHIYRLRSAPTLVKKTRRFVRPITGYDDPGPEPMPIPA